MKGKSIRYGTMTVLLLIVFGLAWQGCLHGSDNSSDDTMVSSRAYKGHASDQDINNFATMYPHTIGTRLDDCQTCHRAGQVTNVSAGKTQDYNPCSFCHLIPFPPASGDTLVGLPVEMKDTLNPYGLAYLRNGRDLDALLLIQGKDSDNDGFKNLAEIKDLRYPGDDGSYPGLPLCPSIKVTMSQLKAMPAHTQFGLANTTKQQFDYYATYTGVKIIDLLTAEGIPLNGGTGGATGVDIMSPDMFTQSFSIAEITDQFPYHQFFSGFGVDSLSNDCAFVEYPANTYSYAYGDTITDPQWHILAYKREGVALDPVSLDPATGKIDGEGPLRNIIPPGSSDYLLNQPDRGKNAVTTSCVDHSWDYDFNKVHNAGRMAKGAVIIRINPMPAGCEEFDLNNGGWGLADEGSVLIYGHSVSP